MQAGHDLTVRRGPIEVLQAGISAQKRQERSLSHGSVGKSAGQWLQGYARPPGTCKRAMKGETETPRGLDECPRPVLKYCREILTMVGFVEARLDLAIDCLLDTYMAMIAHHIPRFRSPVWGRKLGSKSEFDSQGSRAYRTLHA